MTSRSGKRLRTQQHLTAKRNAELFVGLEPGDHRYSVIRILRDVGKELGWTSSLVTHLEMLINCTHANDWTASGMPIVWLSQKHMAEKLSISPSQTYRNERRLMELGAIAFVDGQNKQRVGIDLRPVASLLKTLKVRQRSIEKTRQMRSQLRRAIGSLRTKIKGTLAVPENRSHIPPSLLEAIADDNMIYGSLPPRQESLDVLQDHFDHLQQLYDQLSSAILKDTQV